MKPTEDDINLLERYFDAELSAQELSHFNSRVEHDEAFKALFQREKIIIGAIRNQGLIDNLQYLKSVEEKIQGNQSHPSGLGRNWYYYAAAAVVAILIALTYLLPGQQSTEELFASYFAPYPNVFEPTVRGNDDPATNRTQAFQAYERKDYQTAASGFTALLNVKEEPGILLLLGNSNLMLGNTKEAQENFVTLINNYDDLDLQAKWFLSLSYLKSGDKENARKILEELGETDISYASKAKELLEKVN